MEKIKGTPDDMRLFNPTLCYCIMWDNLMSLFRQGVLKSKFQATLSTLRFKCFALGSWISKHDGKTTLYISVIGEKRKWLIGSFDIVRHSDKSFYFSNA